MAIIVPRKRIIVSGDLEITPWDEFQPADAFRHARLSGVELAQDQPPHPEDFLWAGDMIFQSFGLPQNFVRGTAGGNEGGEAQAPDITGVQICFNVQDTDTFFVNVAFGVREFGDWVLLAAGSVKQAHAAGDFIWIDVYFDKPISVANERIKREWYVGIQSPSNAYVSRPAPINDGRLMPKSNKVGIPNDDRSMEGSLMFRLLTASADNGVDFLGNTYRHVVSRNAVDRVTTVGTDKSNGFWMSKPNPSKFAVESLYFDVRNENHEASVIDRVLIDPITPSVYFHIYYTSEGKPVNDDDLWANKLWKPVFYDFHAERRQEFALPEPITAKYLKVEFSHLQPQHYSGGSFAQPVRYQKHPKWVLEYFMKKVQNQIRVTEDPFVSRSVRVLYDSLELGYSYHLDDLTHAPYPPQSIEQAPQSTASYLTDRTDVSDQIAPETLQAIQREFRRFQQTPDGNVRDDHLLAQYTAIPGTIDYPVEGPLIRPRADTSSVSTPDRMSLIIEQDYPIMLFFVPCRHSYRQVEAKFEQDRAYFVGVRELAFTREHYNVATDTPQYIENLGDFANVLRNDFISEDFDPFEVNHPEGNEPPAPPQSLVVVSNNIIPVE